MPQSLAPVTSTDASVVDGRFRLQGILGEGGMATVHAAVDERSGERVALKRLRPREAESLRRARQLFEREYHTLASLGHPRVVQVLDFGMDAEGPYYTMELLDGGDIESRTPVPWRTACSLMRDVCSVLSLLHSRGLVHGDITARNVRCTQDGLAKLLDFGAMAAMGPCRNVVGTPTTCAPEVFEQGELSGRTDLYSLGCTFYFAMTGRHPYPARELSQLPLLWGSTPDRPMRLADGIPTALDNLIMSLISVDPSGRPESAAEVMERLTALAALPPDEQLKVERAYLSSPTLVGQAANLSRLRKRLERAREGRGSTSLVRGDPGLGRSRLLEAGLLQARFAGLRTLRADATDAAAEGGVLAALGRRLWATETQLAREAAQTLDATLCAVVDPSLCEASATPSAEARPARGRAEVQRAYCAWIEAVSARCPLALVVDDLDAIDELSASVLALLAHRASKLPLALLLSAGPPPAHGNEVVPRLLIEHATCLTLQPLSAAATGALLRSVFGDVPHLRSLTSHLHALAQGNPRDVVALAQHLLERGVVRYQSGSWQLPPRLNADELPRDMAEALGQVLDQLDADSLQVGRLWGLAPELRADLRSLQIASGIDEAERVERAVQRLASRGLLRAVGRSWALAHGGWVSPLRTHTDEATRRTLHGRLVEAHLNLGDTLGAARHAFGGGEDARGLALVLEHARTSQALSDNDERQYEVLLATLPEDWLRIYERAFAQAERDCTVAERFALYRRVSGFVAGTLHDTHATTQSMKLLEHAVGLDLLPTLDTSLDDKSRIGLCLKLAQERYESTPEGERLMPAAEAIRLLAGACTEALGSCASTQNLALWEAVPSLEPLTPLAPALHVVDALRRGLGARLRGRPQETIAIYEEVLERLAEPDGGGLPPTHRRYTEVGVACGLAVLYAQSGDLRALELAQRAEQSSVYAVSALLAKAVHCLWQGDAEGARRERERAEVLQLEHRGRRFREGGHLMGALVAHAASDDLVQLKADLPEAERMAAAAPAWEPVARFARGEFHRVRGALPEALHELERAAALVSAGRHQLYAEIVGAQLRVLGSLGQLKRACQLGRAELEAAEGAGLGYTTHFIRMPLAELLARSGEGDEARRLAAEVLQDLQQRCTEGLLVGLAHEAAARVAMALGERDTFEHHAQEAGKRFRVRANRALTAKHARLLHDAADRGLRPSTPPTETALHMVQISTVLSGCDDPTCRAVRALQVLVEAAGASGGALFRVEADGPTLAARQGADIDEDEVLELARARLMRELPGQMDPATATASAEGAIRSLAPSHSIAGDPDHALRLLLLGHVAEGDFLVTGLVVLRVAAKDRFHPPTALAIDLSRYWHDVGDSLALGTQTQWDRTVG